MGILVGVGSSGSRLGRFAKGQKDGQVRHQGIKDHHLSHNARLLVVRLHT